MHDTAEAGDGHWSAAGERIQNLLDASAAAGPVAQERAERLVREVSELYGEALSRIATSVPAPVLDRLTADELVASLLLVHGLHPHDLRRRVADALDRVRPYLGSHGGDVELIDVADEVVRLRFAGSCRSCPSSSVTLELAVEDAIRAAAPEIESIEVVAAEPEPDVIAPASLFARVHASGTEWHPAPAIAGLASGDVGGFAVAGSTILACRVGDELYAYRDRCGNCTNSLAGTALHRRPGHPVGDAVLTCPHCRAHYDVVHAGAGLDTDAHLDPLPLLIREGNWSVALPAGVAG